MSDTDRRDALSIHTDVCGALLNLANWLEHSEHTEWTDHIRAARDAVNEIQKGRVIRTAAERVTDEGWLPTLPLGLIEPMRKLRAALRGEKP